MSKKIIESIKSIFSRAESELSTLRDEIRATNAEIEILENRPIDLQTAQGKLRQGIADIGGRFAEAQLKAIPFLNECNHPNSLALNFQNANPFEFMCWAQPELVQQKMEVVLRDFLKENPGINPAERAEKLAESRGILHKLELDEETLVRGANESGMSVGRRPDANPEVVLGA